jgi:radical SAM superfamily enzyme YgiQ (UPF0313 family)
LVKIKIIYPSRLDETGKVVKAKTNNARFLNLSTIYLGGLTPPRHEVSYVDDIFEDINFDERVDLAAITAMTSQATRAYQLAQEFRKRGAKVVIGGLHPSFRAEEAGNYADAVVIGEAERSWPQLLHDLENGELKKVYRSELVQDMSNLPAPRYDLVAGKKYYYNYYPLWAGRGCPHNCSFCSVTNLFGSKVRIRPVRDIIRDAALIPVRQVLMVDDNILSYGPMLNQLLPELAQFKFKWIGQTDINMADKDHLLDLAQKAGMEIAYIGFETVFEKQIGKMSKSWATIEKYQKVIAKLHRRGIIVHASMMMGWEPESLESIATTLKQLEQWKVDGLSLYLFTLVPGSRLREEADAEHKPCSTNWSLYDGNHVTLDPPGMSAGQLEDLYWTLNQKFYSPFSIAKRFSRVPYGLRNWAMYLARNLLLYRTDVNMRRSVFDNYFSLLELLPGYSARK